MLTVRWVLAACAGVVGALLAVLSSTSRLGVVGWLTGPAATAVLCAAVVRATASAGVLHLGPADLVTLLRASLTCAAAALVADSLADPRPVDPLAVVAATALALDLVDGQVARRTATVSAFGAHLDGEADAALMLVLSVALVPSQGAWVLAIGGVRYAFAVAGRLAPWLAAALPFRYWRKVVTAVSGIALVLAVAQLLPAAGTTAGLALAVALLAESFGRDVRWLWRRRATATATPSRPADLLGAPRR